MSAEQVKQNQWGETIVADWWTRDYLPGAELMVTSRPESDRWNRGDQVVYIGYVRFQNPPLHQLNKEGIVYWTEVHGGISYFQAERDEMGNPTGPVVYSFDTAHAGDEKNPELQKLSWARAETELLALNIIKLADYEQRYRKIVEDADLALGELGSQFRRDLARTALALPGVNWEDKRGVQEEE